MGDRDKGDKKKGDPMFCEERCPVCVNGREGKKFARALQNLEMKLTHGGCPNGRAREEMFGYPPTEKIPEDVKTRVLSQRGQ